MNDIRARIRVGPDHRISGTAPLAVPPGEHDAVISLRAPHAGPPLRRSTPATCRATIWDPGRKD